MNSNELKHHGVKGQKWGVRRFQNADGSLKPAGRKRYNDDVNEKKAAYKDAKKAYNKSFRSANSYSERHFISQYVNKDKRAESDRRWNDAADKAKALDKAKKDYKQAKASADKAAVKKYEKKFNEAEKASNIADKKWNEVSEQYKALGKTRIERMLNAARNKSDAAKKYNKSYDEASKLSDLADQKWNDAKKEYVNTGRNRVEQLLNNVKYGS